MKYFSTRSKDSSFDPSNAIINGISLGGGLFVPDHFPPLFPLTGESGYGDLAHAVLSKFLTDFSESQLNGAVKNAYMQERNFDTPHIAPLVNFHNLSFLELFHGRTLSFKDMALCLLPYLIEIAEQNIGDNRHKVILTATSGDTGKAALEAFRDISNTTIIVFYPQDGVSPLQKQTMITSEGSNVHVFGVKGNFDHAQSGIKKMLSNEALVQKLSRKGMAFSSANSINIGRLLPQVVYYFYAYSQLVQNGHEMGRHVNFVVPTGNFGNILSGYYAAKMGLPVNKLICATNSNNVMFKFFTTNIFSPNKKFFTTISPAMDINIPSNFERLVYQLTQDAEQVKSLFKGLESDGQFTIDTCEQYFTSYYATEEETRKSIQDCYKNYGYIIDPHTAVGYCAYEKYAKENPNEPTVIISTASPYKFTKTVMDALRPDTADLNDFQQIEGLAKLKSEDIPRQIAGIEHKKVLHDKIVDIGDMEDVVRGVLGRIDI